MDERMKIEDLGSIRKQLSPFLTSKLEEFQLLGLEHITMDELWTFTLEKMKKKRINEVYLHEAVNFIMRLSVNDYMNKIRLEMFRGLDLEVFREQS